MERKGKFPLLWHSALNDVAGTQSNVYDILRNHFDEVSLYQSGANADEGLKDNKPEEFSFSPRFMSSFRSWIWNLLVLHVIRLHFESTHTAVQKI